MCISGLETSITRTPLASTHILSILAGSSQITVPCLASALTALYITLGFPFIMSQRDRNDTVFKVWSSAACGPGCRPGTTGHMEMERNGNTLVCSAVSCLTLGFACLDVL